MYYVKHDTNHVNLPVVQPTLGDSGVIIIYGGVRIAKSNETGDEIEVICLVAEQNKSEVNKGSH